jgi:hypothetical protein
MRKRWFAASAATVVTFATIMPSADAATSWRTFGAARAASRSGVVAPPPFVQVSSQTRRNPRVIRFIVDTHDDHFGSVSWSLGCVNFDTGHSRSRDGDRGFRGRFVKKFDTLPTGKPDFCVLMVSTSTSEPSRLTLTLQARYP